MPKIDISKMTSKDEDRAETLLHAAVDTLTYGSDIGADALELVKDVLAADNPPGRLRGLAKYIKALLAKADRAKLTADRISLTKQSKDQFGNITTARRTCSRTDKKAFTDRGWIVVEEKAKAKSKE